MTIKSGGTVLEALGIAVGDKVWSPYSEEAKLNPTYYKVISISGPYWWRDDTEFLIWPYPVICLTLKYWNRKDNSILGINDIHRDVDRWFDDQGYEVFVEKPKKPFWFASDLFPEESDHEKPYQFNPDLDYSDPDKIFKCQKCGLDFNGELVRKFVTPYCPVCGISAGVSRKIIVMDKVIPGKSYFSAYQRILGAKGYPEVATEIRS